MGRNHIYTLLVTIAAAAMVVGATPAAEDMCSSLMNNATLRALPNTAITSAATVSGTFTPPGGKAITGMPSFCRVTATLKPSPASDIKVEIWMPSQGWNGKLEGIGNGGLAGSISYTNLPNYVDHASLQDAVKSGYVGASTDTGHVASDRTWLANVEKERDYGYRAIHEMTVTAKTAVQQFYGSVARHSYFNGCSTGGGQALGEAQLYPDDYDGVLAGDAQNYLTHSRAADLWQYQMVNSDSSSKLSKNTLALITKAVLGVCGSDYGAPREGFLSSDPRQCWFGPEQLLCKEGQSPTTCLTEAQVRLVTKIYEGYYIVPGSTQEVVPGLPPGSEAPAGPGSVGWGSREYLNGGAIASSAAAQFYSLGVLQDANVDLRKVDLASAVAAADKKFGFIDHISTDLDPFLQHGKLLVYHGWDDPSISALNAIDYYSAVVKDVSIKRKMNGDAALKEVQNAYRMFVVPGMGHCGGGPGPDTFDALGTLDQWVDHGVAPDKIDASHMTNGAKTYTRPLCPYPQIADYKGTGDRKDAGNWACVKEHWNFELYDRYFYGSLSQVAATKWQSPNN